MEDIINLFPSTKDELQLDEVDLLKLTPSIAHLFSQIVEQVISIRNSWQKSEEHDENIEFLNKLESALSYVWEQLHTGQWKDVDRVWRQLYSYVSLFKTFIHLLKSNKKTQFHSLEIALKACDMGLIMGEPILDDLLSEIADKLNIKLWESTKSTNSELQDVTELEKDCSSQHILDESKLIETVHLPSMEKFMRDFMRKNRPVKITGAMDFWPAMMKESRWSLDYLRRMAGYRTVPIEIGSKYTDDSWSQSLTTVNDFIDHYIVSPNKSTGYLAQYQLFQQIPKLKEDIFVPDYCFLGESDDIQTNAWFGPGGTVSPLHYDPDHNFLSQIVGYKYIRLYDQQVTPLLYPHQQELLFNTSRVDVEDPDLVHFPLFPSAPYVETVLSPGSMLYIPARMWHYVRSLSTSFSVSFWWK